MFEVRAQEHAKKVEEASNQDWFSSPPTSSQNPQHEPCPSAGADSESGVFASSPFQFPSTPGKEDSTIECGPLISVREEQFMALDSNKIALTNLTGLETSGATENQSMPGGNFQKAKNVVLSDDNPKLVIVEDESDSDQHDTSPLAQQTSAGKKTRRRRHRKGERGKAPERAPSPPKRNPYLDLEAGLEFNVS